MSQYKLYLLTNLNCTRTYYGITNQNVYDRLRQHNQEVKTGGAKATRNDQWQVVFYVTGFDEIHYKCRSLEWELHDQRKPTSRRKRKQLVSLDTKNIIFRPTTPKCIQRSFRQFKAILLNIDKFLDWPSLTVHWELPAFQPI